MHCMRATKRRPARHHSAWCLGSARPTTAQKLAYIPVVTARRRDLNRQENYRHIIVGSHGLQWLALLRRRSTSAPTPRADRAQSALHCSQTKKATLPSLLQAALTGMGAWASRRQPEKTADGDMPALRMSTKATWAERSRRLNVGGEVGCRRHRDRITSAGKRGRIHEICRCLACAQLRVT